MSFFDAIRRLIKKVVTPPARYAFDVSNFWRSGTVAQADANEMMRQAAAIGYEGVMLGTYDLNIASVQCFAALRARLFVDAFAYIYADNSDGDRINKASRLGVPGLCWIDCEDESADGFGSLSVSEVVETIQHAIDLAWSLGMRPAIYTRESWWKTYTGNTDRFSMYPLWIADPDGVPLLDRDYWNAHRFGAWAMPVWKQYEFNARLAGMNVDLSVRAS